MILAADVGGTKTHLAIFEENPENKWVVEEKFPSAQFENLPQIVKAFLQKHPKYKIEKACFGVAGPIFNRTCHATNLPWIVDADLLQQETGIKQVFLINDLEANAFGINVLKEEEFYVLNQGKKQVGNAALLSAGTGLGEAILFWNKGVYHPVASEGGHCSFAPEDKLQIQLLCYLKKKYEHVSFERILSGSGLWHLYSFLVEEGIETEDVEAKKQFEKVDPARVISERGLKKQSRACEKALELFVSIYGSEAANLALKVFGIGGIYIGGGIAPKILPCLQQGGFMKSFVQKGRFTSFLKDIPVKVILNENTALLGAYAYARQS